MKRSIIFGVLALAGCGAPGPGAPAPGDPDPGPLSIILMIADGGGLDYWSAAKLTSSVPLAIEEFPVVGLVDTRSANARATDSGAGATAYAAGVRTLNYVIGVGPDSTPVQTVLELAESKGWSTGMVATSAITHATPAAFGAHVPDRNMYYEIARQLADQRIEVLLGGGRQYFQAATRDDGVDLMPRLTRGATYVEDPDTFLTLDPDTVRALVGLFADNQPPRAPGRAPLLGEMTRTALAVLEKDRDGFFLMVEGSQIDWRGHENAPLRDVVAEVQDFDLAIREALLFQERRPNTLIVVTADHSTGGLALHADDLGVFRAHYTTAGHTAGMVPLFARGPNAAAFGGIMDNDRVGRLLLQMVREERVPTTLAR